MKNGVTIVAEGAKRIGDWTVAQFNVLGLSHDAIGVRNGEIREAAMVLLEALWALCIWLVRHLSV